MRGRLQHVYTGIAIIMVKLQETTKGKGKKIIIYIVQQHQPQPKYIQG